MTTPSELPSELDDVVAAAGPQTLGARIRTYFLTGIVVIGPVAVTAYVTLWVIGLIDGWVRPLIPVDYWPDKHLPFTVPGLGVLIAFFSITLLGFLTANFVGRTLYKVSDRVMGRMPLVRGLYKGVKQVFETIFSNSGSSFRKVGLVEFPNKGQWSLVFISTPPGSTVTARLPQGEEFLSVFLPCTPNPTTGFFFYLPARDVIEISMSPEEAAKLIMSAGVIQPEAQASLGALAMAGQRGATPAAAAIGRSAQSRRENVD